MRWFPLLLSAGSLACAQGHESRPIGGSEPPPPSVGIQGLGYDDAVRLGAAWAQNQGYQASLVAAQQGGARTWVLRYSVQKHGRQGGLKVSVDTVAGQVTHAEEGPLEIARPPPAPPAP